MKNKFEILRNFYIRKQHNSSGSAGIFLRKKKNREIKALIKAKNELKVKEELVITEDVAFEEKIDKIDNKK